MRLQSDPGRGTILSIRLPFRNVGGGSASMIFAHCSGGRSFGDAEWSPGSATATHADLQVVGEASDGREALNLVETLRPDVVVLDITMPLLNGGIDAARQMAAKQLGNGQVIMLSMHSRRKLRPSCDEGRGARVSCSKSRLEIDLLHAIRTVTQGQGIL